MKQDLTISTDRSRLDLGVIHGFLSQSYWARDIPLETVRRSVDNSLCFGAYWEGGRQVGFARVITDYATFGYVADVFVLPEYRGRGISKALMAAIRAHPDLQGLRRLLLITQDAQGLYAQFGFQPVPNPEAFMTLHRPDMYIAEKQSAPA
jgi:N-acetylglutamate synthase-like GNAT family acetyltransferase